MKRNSVLLVILCVGLLVGCSDPAPVWIVDQRPETEEERAAVAKTETEFIARAVNLGGHDQDWDDAIRMAHEAACSTHCKRRLYEKERRDGWWYETGRMKEVGK